MTLENALSMALLYECRHLTQLHAAGAVVNGRALIALGGSGAGKSSLALGWTLAGCPSLGDDVVLLDAGGMTRPFPRHFKLDPEVLRSYGLEPEGTPFWNPDTREAWFTPSGISGWAESVAIGLVALCRRSIGAHVSLTPLPRSEGVNALLHSVLDTGLDPNSSFRPILDAMQSAQVVELRYGSAHEAARTLAEYMA